MLERASITFRLSLLFAVASVLMLAGIGAYLYRSLEYRFAQRDTDELVGKVELVRYILSGTSSRQDVPSRRQDFAHVVVGHPSLYLAVLDEDGEALFASSRLRLPEALLRKAVDASTTPTSTELWQPSPDQRYRTLAAWVDLASESNQRVLIALALDTAEQRALLASYRHHLVIALLSGGVLAALMSFLVVRHGLRPLRRMAATAYQISVDRLSERLNIEHVPAELKQLATAFNAMLARIEDSFGRLAGFSSDLAHELRTPINNLMGQTQVALTRTRSAEEYRRVLESNLEECERLARMIADMLFLARADHAQVTLRTESVDLRAELDKVAEFYEAHAQNCGVRIVCAGEGRVAADRLLVQRAVSNLLSNAIRHTPKGGEVRLWTVHDDNATVTVNVSNPGPGIPREHLDRVFDRFYRIDSSRGVSHEGVGLGLAIVRSIMVLHGGRVSVASMPDRVTTFALHFPAVPAGVGRGPDRAVPPTLSREAFRRKGLTA
ncbi:histidine kinase [Sulfuricaulis limicola]|uniref:Sensor protein n=1 Tax=Sulfuricaulis limicola TaxID=1620215 RepID=A0A1B4XER6_9GAMM|nr:heavy metal sensor histidine kinase [Sulfuricaulis limicola]BAV33290.1 histidine kinase [Sulfuricaulis limicola]